MEAIGRDAPVGTSGSLCSAWDATVVVEVQEVQEVQEAQQVLAQKVQACRKS